MSVGPADARLGLITRQQVQMDAQLRRKRSLDAQIEMRQAKRARTEEDQIALLDQAIATLDNLNVLPVRATELRYPELLPKCTPPRLASILSQPP